MIRFRCTHGEPHPVVVHIPARKHSPLWLKLVGIWRHRFELGLPWPAGIEAVTWLDRDRPSLLGECFARNGWPLTKLFTYRPWSNREKLRLVADHARRDGPGLVLGLDADDVLLAGDPAELVSRFRQMAGRRLIFNAEWHCWPKGCPAEAAERERSLGPTKWHLNAGAFIGERPAVVEFFDEALRVAAGYRHPDEPDDDQSVLRQFWHRRDWVDLDREGRLIRCVCGPYTRRMKRKKFNVTVERLDP